MDCDVLIIGAGQAATPLAQALAAAGRSVCVAERAHLGGSCVNFGCTPTKAAIASAQLAHQARRAAEFGLRIPEVEVDFPAVIERARTMAERGRKSLEESFGKDENPRLLRGHAAIDGRDGDRFRVAVGDRETVRAREIVLDMGARSTVPPIEGLDGFEPMTAENWLDQRELPAHLAIVGGGYIGLEMAQFYRRMGSAVTVVESHSSVAAQEDDEVADRLQRLLAGEGVAFRLGVRAQRVEADGDGLRLFLDKEAEAPVQASNLFLAVGRTPNTDDMGL